MIGPEGYDPLYDDLDPCCRYFNLAEEQVTFRQYLAESRAPDYIVRRRVGGDYIDPEKMIWVSTVFLGMDHQYNMGGPPLIYETMVFDNREKGRELGVDRYCARYSTREQALAGHRGTVQEFTVLYYALEGISVEGNSEEPVGYVGEGEGGSQPSNEPDPGHD